MKCKASELIVPKGPFLAGALFVLLSSKDHIAMRRPGHGTFFGLGLSL